MKKLTRRNLLSRMGLSAGALTSASPISMLLGSVIQSVAREVQAEELNATDVMNYMSIFLNGGAARWTFDLPLKLYPDDPFEHYPMVSTRLVKGTKNDSLEYATTPVGPYQFPYLWASELPTTGDSWVPMSEVADHMLILRGYRSGSNGHGVSRLRQLQPVRGMPSLTGMAADQADTPIPAIADRSGAGGFKSGTGQGLLLFDPKDPVRALTGPLRDLELRSTRSEDAEAYVRNVITELRNLGPDNHLTRGLYRSRENAVALFKMGLAGLSDELPKIIEKYQNLLYQLTKNVNLPGVDDQELIAKETDDWRYSYSGNNTPAPGEDIRNTFKKYARCACPGIVTALAMAEFLFKNKLSNCVSTAVSGFGLAFDNVYERIRERIVVANPRAPASFNFDSHFTGSIGHMYYLSMFYRVLSTSIREFIHQMKNTRVDGRPVFDRTVVQLNSEFNRSVSSEDNKTGHLGNGCSTSFWSGLIKGPLVIGNIYTLERKGVRSPTVGAGNRIPELFDRVPGVKNVASSVAVLLKTRSPAPNEMPLIRLEDDTVVSNVTEDPKSEIIKR